MNMKDEVQEFDLIVLGTGPAGSTVAQLCARAGAKVLVIESREPGGTCALRGCNPKKVLALAAELSDWSTVAQGKLVSGGVAAVDWAQLRAFTRTFTEPVPKTTRESFRDDGIHLIVGEPKFLDAYRLRVNDQVVKGRFFCLAIGTRPVVPDLPGIEHAIQSDEFFELQDLPNSLLFAGGGYISMEFSHLAARAGSRIQIVDSKPRPLAEFEPELVDALVERSKEAGIILYADRELKRIDKRGKGYAVSFGARDSDDQSTTVDCDLVVLGLGREVDVGSLEIENAGLQCEDGFIVDDDLRCEGAPHIFAAGDCAKTDRPNLTMAANLEAGDVVDGVLQELGLLAPMKRHEAVASSIPAVVFTVPHLGRVGLGEEQARRLFPRLRVASGSHSKSGSVTKRGETHAHHKLLIDEETDRLVGAHFLGPGADELINLSALAMQCEISVTRLRKNVFAFPTFGSELAGLLRSPVPADD